MTNLFNDQIGLQLYTLRDALAAGPLDCLEKVAKIGFKALVQFLLSLSHYRSASFPPALHHQKPYLAKAIRGFASSIRRKMKLDSNDINLRDTALELFDVASIPTMKPMIEDLGMKVVASHFLPGFITGNWETAKKFLKVPREMNLDQMIGICAENGVNNMGVAVLFPEDRETLDDYRRFAAQANIVGEKSQAAGVQFYYHHHSFEFEEIEGTTPFQVMIDHFDPHLVKIELDVFWHKISGNEPTSLIDSLGDQIFAIHLKDLKAGTPRDVTMTEVNPDAFLPLGEGVINFKEILQIAKDMQIRYGFIEQDHHYVGDPLMNITKSFNYLKNLSSK